MDHFRIADPFREFFPETARESLGRALAAMEVKLEDCGERSTVFRRTLPGKRGALDAHVKVYAYLDNPWRRFLRRPKVVIEQRGLQHFAALGIAAPRVAALGWRRGALGRVEYECLVTETVPDALSADRFFAETELFPGHDTEPLRLDCLRAIARNLRRLHDSAYYHRDLFLRNILVRVDRQGAVETVWIDSPRGIRTRLPLFAERCRLRDLASFVRGLRGEHAEQYVDKFLADYFALPKNDTTLNKWRANIRAYIAKRWENRP